MLMLERERLSETLYLVRLKIIGSLATVMTCSAWGLHCRCSSLAVPIECRGERNADRSREERSRRGICVTAWRGHRQTGSILKKCPKIRLLPQPGFPKTWNIMQVSLQVFLTFSKYLWNPRESVCLLFLLESDWPKKNNYIARPWSCWIQKFSHADVSFGSPHTRIPGRSHSLFFEPSTKHSHQKLRLARIKLAKVI